MADKANLIPGDAVLWVQGSRRETLVPAKVVFVHLLLVEIEVETEGKKFTRFVEASRLRLLRGGRKKLHRELKGKKA